MDAAWLAGGAYLNTPLVNPVKQSTKSPVLLGLRERYLSSPSPSHGLASIRGREEMYRQIFCDESRPNCDRYMVIGGIIVPQVSLKAVNARLLEIRDEKGVHAEIKWGKVSKSWLPRYKSILDYFFERNKKDRIHFHCMIFDTHKIDHRVFSNGDDELGFYKFYYQLLLNCFGRHYCPKLEDRFIAYLDQRK